MFVLRCSCEEKKKKRKKEKEGKKSLFVWKFEERHVMRVLTRDEMSGD